MVTLYKLYNFFFTSLFLGRSVYFFAFFHFTQPSFFFFTLIFFSFNRSSVLFSVTFSSSNCCGSAGHMDYAKKMDLILRLLGIKTRDPQNTGDPRVKKSASDYPGFSSYDGKVVSRGCSSSFFFIFFLGLFFSLLGVYFDICIVVK